jgi:TPR repeat protein
MTAHAGISREAAAAERLELRTILRQAHEEYNSTPRRPAQAAALWRLAAERGNSEGQCMLGVCYCCGTGVERDLEQGTQWLRKAAAQGELIAVLGLLAAVSGLLAMKLSGVIRRVALIVAAGARRTMELGMAAAGAFWTAVVAATVATMFVGIGGAVQVDPMKLMLKVPGTKHLKS